MSKKKQEKQVMVLVILMAFIAASVLFAGQVRAGSLEPSATPGPTMKTLDEIPPTWSQILSTASERFEMVLYNEAVLDKETGLVWAKNANIASGVKQWENAVTYCSNLTIGYRKGWRLPTVEELASLFDLTQSNPALSSGYSSFFDNVEYDFGQDSYWTSTTYAEDATYARNVKTRDGSISFAPKSIYFWVWPVRGGSAPILVPHTPSP